MSVSQAIEELPQSKLPPTPLMDFLLGLLGRQRPALGEFLQEYGSLTLKTYAKKLMEPLIHSSPKVIRQELLQSLTNHVTRIYGSTVATELVQQLIEYPIVNNGEHVCLMFHPRRFQSNLLAAFGASAHNLKYVPVLACSTIPLTNSSYPRGVIWYGERLPLVSMRAARSAVFGHPALTKESFERIPLQGRSSAGRRHVISVFKQAVSCLDSASQEQLVRLIERSLTVGNTRALRAFLVSTPMPQDLQERILDEIPKASFIGAATAREIRSLLLAKIPRHAFEQHFLTDQFATINHALWTSSISEPHKLPSLVYVSIDDITIDVIIGQIQASDSWLHKILLNRRYRDAALEWFADIPGSWDSNGKGTQFFWGLDDRLRLTPLSVSGAYLVGKNIRIELTRESLNKALRGRQIVPGVLLNTLILLTSGLRCLGGINQLIYAPLIAARFKAFQREFLLSEIDNLPIDQGPTLLCAPMFFLAKNRITEEMDLGSFPDFLGDSKSSLTSAQRNIERLQVRQAIALGSLDLVKTITPSSEWVPELETPTIGQLWDEISTMQDT